MLPYLKKGQLVGISGEASLKEWSDKEGVKKVNLEVRVNDVTLLGKSDGEKPPVSEHKVQPHMPPSSKSGFEDFSDDIPF